MDKIWDINSFEVGGQNRMTHTEPTKSITLKKIKIKNMIPMMCR